MLPTKNRIVLLVQMSGCYRAAKGILGFDWPPSSPDLNPIEKVWRWMKNEITNLDTVPTTIEDMKEVLGELWNDVNPEDCDISPINLLVRLRTLLTVRECLLYIKLITYV